MKSIIWLLDPGHGVDTLGKRSPEIPPGVFEWKFNRDMARRIIQKSPPEMSVLSIVSEANAVPLRERVRRANTFLHSNRAPVLISLHSNAAGKGGWSKARGVTIFIEKDPTKDSIVLAESFESGFRKTYPSELWRGVKRKNFQMVRGPKMPAVLLELGFMTSKKDMDWLNGPSRDENRDALAGWIIRVMGQYQERGES